MSGQTYRVTGQLQAFDDLIILRGQNGSTFLHLGHLRGGGMRGGLSIDIPKEVSEVIAAKMDAFEAAGGDAPPYPRIIDCFPDPFLEKALFGDGAVNGFDPAQVDAVRQFVLGHVPEVALRLIDPGSTIQSGLDLFSSGDRDARIQAVRAYPMIVSRIMEDGGLRAIIDQRQELAPALRRDLGLSAEQFRTWSHIQARSADALMGTRDLAGARDLTHKVASRRIFATEISRHLRPDQMPSGFGGVQAVCACMAWAQIANASIGVGMGPFLRMLRRVRAEEWPGLSDRLHAALPNSACRDYVRTVSNGIAHAIAMARLRDAGVDVAPLERSAARLWSAEEIPTGDRLHLQTFLSGYEAMSFDIQDLRAAVAHGIGSVISLKELREFQERWHLTGHAMDDRMMAAGEAIKWPALAGEIAAGGFRFRELNGSAALDAQGKSEKHCVGGYASIVLSGTPDLASAIFSAERDGRVVSTLEIRLMRQDQSRSSDPAGSRFSWAIRQNLARRNADPGPEGREAGQVLLDHLKALPAVRVLDYLRGLRSGTGAIREQLQGSIGRAGCNLLNPDLPRIGIEAYASVLPKSLRSRTARDWEAALTADVETGARTVELLDRITGCGGRILQGMAEIENEGWVPGGAGHPCEKEDHDVAPC